MINAYQIVHSVFERFRGLPVKLAAMTGKSDKWYRSHGEEPKTQNPLSWGNVSEVEHYMRYARKFEGGMRGAGQYLNNLVHKELSVEFDAADLPDVSQADLHLEALDEFQDVQKWLINFDFDHATISQLKGFQTECDEAVDAIMKSKGRARLKQREIEMSSRIKVVAANGGQQ